MVKESQKGQSMKAIAKLGDMLLMMRKDVGINDKNLTNREVISNFVNDIDDPKYDEYFK